MAQQEQIKRDKDRIVGIMYQLSVDYQVRIFG
jgi:hypothetical protein